MAVERDGPFTVAANHIRVDGEVEQPTCPYCVLTDKFDAAHIWLRLPAPPTAYAVMRLCGYAGQRSLYFAK